tara:strand:- start:468 stop:1112 length:645 start_codon:yes stop_codon:yes gene_type:complete
MRLLCSIKNKKKEINVKVPKLENFIHKCYIQIAEEFWSSTYLFNENITKLEIQKNKRQINSIVKASIEEVIRRSLPIKSILKDYLETNLETESEVELNNSLIDIIETNKNKNTEIKKNNTEQDTNNQYNTEYNNTDNKNTFKSNSIEVSESKNDCILSEKILSDNIDEKINNDQTNNFNFDENLFINSLEDNIIDEPNQLYTDVKLVNIANEDE